MGKVISSYAGFTASVIKSWASVPAQADMTVNGNDVDCVNLAPEQIGPVLGISTRDWGELCTSGNVNSYSFFGPIEWSLSSGIWSSAIKYPYDAGAFAGYNHSAVAPSYISKTTGIDLYEGSTASKTFNCTLNLGEIDWKAVGAAGSAGLLTRIKMKVTIDGSEYENDIVLSSTYLTDTLLLSVTVPYTALDRWSDISCEVYFSSDLGGKVCNISNLSSWSVGVIYHERAVANSLTIDPTTMANNPTWTHILETSKSVNQDDDTWSITIHGIDTGWDEIGDVYLWLTKLQVYARKNSTGNWEDCGDFFQPNYNESQTALGDLPFSITYGDTVQFRLFEESTI
jgi:hypothetical protein